MWSLVACLASEDGRTRIDSEPQPVDLETPNAEVFTWIGDVCDPVLSLDGFLASSEMLTLSFRLIKNLDRVALSACRIHTSTIVYSRTGSPRRNKPVSDLGDRRRHSVYGHEDLGIEKMQPVDVMEIDNVKLSYVASRYRDDENSNGEIAKICILKLELNLRDTDFKTLLTQRGHKVCCLLTLTSDYTAPILVYLGRAQEINTNEQQKRVYKWISKDSEVSPPSVFRGGGTTPRLLNGIPPPGQELADAADLLVIGKGAQQARDPRTPRNLVRAQSICNPSYVQDNDAFYNAYKKLPLTIHQRESLCVSLYNFKIGPPFGPYGWHLTLKWADFVDAVPETPENLAPVATEKRRSSLLKRVKKPPSPPLESLQIYYMQRNLTPDLVLTIGFALLTIEKQIRLETIKLHATNFESSLVKSQQP
jgi:hypothetical protein